MYQRRTRHFHITLSVAAGLSACYLLILALFGRGLAAIDYQGVTAFVFSVMVLAVASFLAFSFLPYFQNERRWFVIPALLVAVFLAGAVLLWQLPLPVEVAA